MWTFDNFPITTVNQQIRHPHRSGLAGPRAQRLGAHPRLLGLVSCRREGLILTNWHCVVGCAQELSTPTQDYVKNGFMSATREEETPNAPARPPRS
jgi:hypothetical protein